MTDREVMQQALDALNLPSLKTQQMLQQRDEAIATLRAQLEQPEQVSHAHEWFRTGAMEPGKMRCIHCGASGNDASLTTSPQQQTEPVAWTTMPEAEDWCFVSGSKDPTGKLEGKWSPLYTTQLLRKPLTDADIKLVMNGRGEEGDDDYIKPAFDPYGISEDDLLGFARAIEQAHGIGEKP